ncbi:MAG: hypothetical protein O9353_14055 [Bacteroidia bacterium]|nr:hypothetical protein [Polaromonas sp.]MCZ8286570.1 hypothetical protein [Bacteroidia bacterium]
MNTRVIPNPFAWPMAVLLSMGSAAAFAQASPYPQPDPRPTEKAANPATPVPAALYRSAFAGLPAGVEQANIDWKKSNADAGQFKRGHADLLKWEQSQAAQPAAPAASKP